MRGVPQDRETIMTSWHDLNPRARMERTTTELTVAAPFFSALFCSQELEERESIGTAAVNGKSVIYAPSYVAGLSELECLGMAAHESLHLALLHHVRRGSRDPALWNRACDLELNPMVLASGFVLPKGALLDARFAGWSAEAIYASLESESGGEGGGDADSGAPDPEQDSPAPDPGQCGGVIDAAESAVGMAEARASAEAMVRQALSVARASNDGAIPDAFKPLVTALNRAPIDWRAELAEFIDDAAQCVASWNVPNKRHMGSGFILPGSTPDGVSCVALAVDCSGSIGKATLEAFQGIGQQLLDDGRVARLCVVYCHSRVCGSAEFSAGDVVKLEITESGGTSFAPALAHVERHWPDAVAVAYLTDLEVYSRSDFGPAPSMPVLWAVQGERRKAPFGRVLPIDPHS
jgi:predicted metal-dependent peptidase